MHLTQLIELNLYKLLFFCGGEKGGVGKSTFAKVLTEYLLTNYPKGLGLVECDHSNPDVGRIFQDKALKFNLAFFSDDPSKREYADPVFGAANDNRITVCNLPAQVHQTVKTWIMECALYELAEEEKLKFVYWHVSDGGNDSMKLSSLTIEDFSPYMQIVFVRNRGLRDDWTHVDEDEELQSVFAKHNIPVIDLPKLPYAERNFMEALQKDHQITFTEAVEYPGLSQISQQRIKVFLRKCFAQIESIEFFSYGK